MGACPSSSCRNEVVTKILGRKAVVCVHGLASSALEVKVDDDADIGGCRQCHSSDFEVLYLNVGELVLDPAGTLERLELEHREVIWPDGSRHIEVDDQIGVEIRPVQGVDAIRTLNPHEPLIPVAVWGTTIDTLAEEYNVSAFNYDWRLWGEPTFAEETADEFKDHVERQFRKAGHQPVAIIGHSMGANVVMYCISVQPDAWIEYHISEVVLVGPAVMGSPTMTACYAVGPGASGGQSMIPLGDYAFHMLGRMTCTWPCMLACLPHKVGDIDPFPEDYVFVKTPSGKYTLNNLGEWLEEIGVQKGGAWANARLLRNGADIIAQSIRGPPVPLHFFYSNSVDTSSKFKFDGKTMRAEIIDEQPGDDTIVASSVEALAREWQKLGTECVLHLVPGKVRHRELIACEFFQEEIFDILASADDDDDDKFPAMPTLPRISDFDFTNGLYMAGPIFSAPDASQQAAQRISEI